MMDLPGYIAIGFIGVFVLLVLAILVAAWAEKRALPPIDWDGGDEP